MADEKNSTKLSELGRTPSLPTYTDSADGSTGPMNGGTGGHDGRDPAHDPHTDYLEISINSEQVLQDDEEPEKFHWGMCKTKDGLMTIFSRVIFTLFPILVWLPGYRKHWKDTLYGDLKAAFTVGILLVPQGLAYALLAELPVQYGLYSAFIGPLIYAVFGTSKELSVAPVAVASLLTSSGLSTLYDPKTETPQYVDAAVALALMLGIIQAAMGFLRLGFIINFLSHSVLSGFTSAAALVIGLSQLKHVLGLDIPRSSHVHEVLEDAFKELDHANWRTIIVSVTNLTVLLVWKYAPRDVKYWKYIRQLPSAMIVVLFTTIASAELSLEDYDVKVVGDVPEGLPNPEAVETTDLGDVLVLALTIALVTYMESMAVAKKYADMRGYHIDYNQELVALGMCNMIGSVFRNFPTTGGFSRTAVNANAGAQTQLASLLSAVVVMIALLAATSLFYHLPKATLGCIIMVAVFPLIDVMEPYRLWKISKLESLLLVITFALSAFVGIELGVGISIGLALLVVVWQSSRPHYALEGRIGTTPIYRNIKRYPQAVVPAQTVIFRFDANLFFANSAFFERKFKQRCMRKTVKRIILNFASVNAVDSQGLHVLHDLIHAAHEEGKNVIFANVKGPVRDVFSRSGMTEDVGAHNFYNSVHQAVQATEPDAKIEVASV